MPRAALAALIVLLPAVGCGSEASDSRAPIKLVDEPRTIGLGFIGAPLAVDGDALVHVAFRNDRMVVVRRDLSSGAARTLLRRPAEPWSVEGIAARDGRVAVELSASRGYAIVHRVLEPSPSGGRARVLRSASEHRDCGGKVSVHNITPAKEILVSEVRGPCGRERRWSLGLHLHGETGSRAVLRRRVGADRAGRLIIEPVLRAGVGGGRMFVADPEAIEIVEPTGSSRVIGRPSSGQFAGAEINDHGDLVFRSATGGRLSTGLLRLGQDEPVELFGTPRDRAASVRLCGDLIVRHARRVDGKAELSVARVADATRYRRLRAWPARLADAELVCDERRAVLIRQRGGNGPSSAEVVVLPR
jgi:hypothetical protein